MKAVVNLLFGFVIGYLLGIALGGTAAFALGFDDARFIAMGCGLLGALLGSTVVDRLQRQTRVN